MNERTQQAMEAVAGRSLWADAWARLTANRATLSAAIVLLVIVGLAIVGPLLSPNRFDSANWSAFRQPPSLDGGHIFGTDGNGRDLFVRTMLGAKISLALGVLATLVSLAIGVAWGAIAGYAGGRVDVVMMRIVDILYAMPFMFFVILLMVVFGRNMVLIFLALGAVEWLTMARIVRGQTMSLKTREFIDAARIIGLHPARLVIRHILPNLLGVVVIYMTLTIPQVILIESFLSFLGLGVQEPYTSWGVLIKEGADEMETAIWLLLFPAGFLAVTLFCLNFLGDGLRDALDPKDR